MDLLWWSSSALLESEGAVCIYFCLGVAVDSMRDKEGRGMHGYVLVLGRRGLTAPSRTA